MIQSLSLSLSQSQSLLRLLLSLRVVVVCLALLMMLVVLGTLYQVEHGLYAAQERYFYSWVVLLFGFIPIPGAQSVMWVLFLNLTAAMFYRFRLGWRQSGLLAIHLGLMLMLAGGWVTRQTGEESFLSLVEGEGSNVSSAYRDWELSVWKPSGAAREVTGVDLAGLAPGIRLVAAGYDLPITVREAYAHSRAFTGHAHDHEPAARNASGIVRLEPAPRNRDPEADLPGLVIDVDVGGPEPERILLFGADTAPTEVTRGEDTFVLSLRRKRFPLPVFMTLIDFRKAFYPGTETPKSFASLVEVQVQDMARDVVVEMNEPFRYQGYTFYQASYSDMGGGLESSTFAVTKNYGRLIPYFATALTVAGLAVHFVMEMLLRGRIPVRRGKS